MHIVLLRLGGKAGKKGWNWVMGGAQQYVSHAAGDCLEPLSDHLREVSEMAAHFARPFGGEDWAAVVGMAHDIGKYSREFQNRILHGGKIVNHTTAGAEELNSLGFWQLAYCVSGHHGGLPNGGTTSIESLEKGTLFSRLQDCRKGKNPDYSAFRQEIDLASMARRMKPPSIKLNQGDAFSAWYSMQFLIRMVFSCLVDADFLCTERFMAGERHHLQYEALPALCEKLEQKLSSFYPPKSFVNAKRCEVLDACLRAASWEPGVFSLTVPTGGGKTFASLRFALNHAIRHENAMRRIIYAIPYTSIIDQNAKEFRRVLGNENVLEHHANFDFDDQGELGERLRLAAENWDAPVVVTTNVQLFESLYSNRTSQCRKLHNIAGSVIVLDEAQMIPTEQLQPCIRALAELVKNYNCSVVLCTATQPALDFLFEKYGCTVREIISDAQPLFNALERVCYKDAGVLSDEELANSLLRYRQSLCIVNSRRQARQIYGLIKYGEGAFHLTTSMHADHRKHVLAEIKRRMSDGSNEPCHVVATSLVEAGVNLDFPVVYRAFAGIDSIVQAAGRCNREGKLDRGTVYVFQPERDYRIPRGINQKRAIAQLISQDLAKDASNSVPLGALSAIDQYFRHLYKLRDKELDAKGVLEMLSTRKIIGEGPSTLYSIPFADASRDFSIIEDTSATVIVASDANEEDVRALRSGEASRATMRRLSRCAVGVYEFDLRILLESGAASPVNGNVYVLDDASAYSEEIGLDVDALEEGKGVFL